MSPSQEQPERQPSGRQPAARDRAADEPVVTTTSAERYVMSGGRASRLAIKEGDLFLYTNELGQVPGTENSALGLYYRDTRYLSRFELTIAGRQPVLLSASADRGYAATVELTNLEARTTDGHTLPQASVHVRRTRFVSDRMYELLRVYNYDQREVDLVIDLHFDADFADLFEVRGSRRRRRGSRLAPRTADGALTLSYLGLDEVTRQTIIRFHDRPESIKQGRARYRLRLAPGERATIRYDVQVVGPGAPGEAGGEFNARIGALRHEHERWESEATGIFTDNDALNRALRRGQDDLRLLSTVIDGDRVPLAGLPWFAAPFGREMAFVGLETLLLDLRWARSAASFLGRRQGTVDNAFREEQPGKIMHELRRGELAAVRAVPHTPYFGSVDATALWLLLVAELAVWTGDLDGFEMRGAAVDAALGWIDGPGDPDGDGFVEYERRSRVGLRNQGWRDSYDAVAHVDGTPARGPHRARRDAGLRLLRQAPPGGGVRSARRRGARRAVVPRRGAGSSAPSTSASGWRTRASTRWRSTGRSARSARSRRRSATRCGRGSWPRSTSRRWCTASWPRTCSPGGASARSARTRASTTR